MSIHNILSYDQLKQIQSSSKLFILFFWAEWHELTNSNGQLQEIYQTLSNKHNNIDFYLIEAENVIDISESLQVSVVPTFISFHGFKQIAKIEGANPSELNKLVKQLNDLSISNVDILSNPIVSTSNDNKTNNINDKLIALINKAPVMLFMKGNPKEPRCGFSRQIVEILTNRGIAFASFDILTDEEVRQGLKIFSDWPTYPQLYVNGELVGGLDIIKELDSKGNLKTELGIDKLAFDIPVSAVQSLEDRIKTLINLSQVVLFMKGSPESPKCGFSRSIVSILKDENIDFTSFDILTDEDIRQGLKKFSDWPTYPQLYVNGDFVGGLDIVKEMKGESTGNLKKELGL